MKREEFVKLLEEFKAQNGELEFWACIANFGCAEDDNQGQLLIYTGVQADEAFPFNKEG